MRRPCLCLCLVSLAALAAVRVEEEEKSDESSQPGHRLLVERRHAQPDGDGDQDGEDVVIADGEAMLIDLLGGSREGGHAIGPHTLADADANGTEMAQVLRRRRRGPSRMETMVQMMRRQAMEQQQQEIRRVEQMVERAQNAPNTLVGGTLLPLLLLVWLFWSIVGYAAPGLHASVSAAVQSGPIGTWRTSVARGAHRRGWTTAEVARVCVCLFFVHEGLACFQTKFEQLEESRSEPILTPFGMMGVLPSWEKGDACDMVLLFTALATLFRWLNVEIGLVLLLVDVSTDTIDLLARIALSRMAGNGMHINELAAKKLTLLGVMALVATHRWREERMALSRRAPHASNGHGVGAGALPSSVESGGLGGGGGGISSLGRHLDEASDTVPPGLLLLGRLLMAVVFIHAAAGELARLFIPRSLNDIDPDDPHNILWPKLVELSFAVPLVLGLRTAASARLLTIALAVEALTCWQFWWIRPLAQRMHAREHFTVNVAVAGGLLLVQELGGGKYAVDELLKKAE
jgi:uncharacterized membrane protein YphA (DoxX/SURF4 family)